MIILFLMSYSLLLRSTNDPPRHPRCLWTAPTQGWRISNLSVVDAALGEVLVSQVFNKPYWGQWDEAGSPDSSPQPPPETLPAPSLRKDPPPCPSHHLPSSSLILPPLRPHSSLLHLPRSACLRSSLPALLQHMPALLGAPVIQRGIRLKELLRTSL